MPNYSRPAFSADALADKARKIDRLAHEAEATARTCGCSAERELADLIDVACHDEWSIRNARGLARAAGATKVGKTRRDAILAHAAAVMRRRALSRSAAISKKCARAYRLLRERNEAYRLNITVAALRARDAATARAYDLRVNPAAARAALADALRSRGAIYLAMVA